MNSSLISNNPFPIMGKSYNASDYLEVELKDIPRNLENTFEYDMKIYSETNSVKLLYGGYLEQRDIYDSFDLFKAQTSSRRNIHLGIDIWAPLNHEIFLPISGTVHSFKDNTEPGSYGPTIIVKHTINQVNFYTLYGHLSKHSLKNLYEGKVMKSGEMLAYLGSSKENGGYAPHLHFQVIKEIGANFGDFPGVCSKHELEYYKQICPDPSFLINFN